MTLDEMQEAYFKRVTARNTRKKKQFVIGPKGACYGDRGRRTISEGNTFKKVGRIKNKNPRYKAELRLGAE